VGFLSGVQCDSIDGVAVAMPLTPPVEGIFGTAAMKRKAAAEAKADLITTEPPKGLWYLKTSEKHLA
jgi:hypothetical protein